MSISSVIAGGEHTCALTSSGGAKCWGLNSYGQLGDGTTTSSSTPVSVSGLTGGTTAVMTGMSYHSCARTLSDGLKCWGLNLYGQLGDGTELPASTTPVTLSVATGTYAYNATHKHAVSSVSNQLSVDSYQYDANGNMTQRVEGGQTYTQTFDAENRLISVTVNSQTTQFIYDGDGNLIKKINPDNSKTLYVGGLYEVNKNAGGTVTGTTTYYPASGAMRVNGTLYYVLKDHLGSASVVTDSSGNIVGEQRYYPFGETRLMTGTLYTDKLFTGQRNIAGLGIYHYQSRFYSPKLGRFLSADSLVPNPFNPQDYSRYSYVRNNPVKYTDPSGHRVWNDDGGGVCGDVKKCQAVVKVTSTKTPTKTSVPTNAPSTIPSVTTTPTPGCSSPTNACATNATGFQITPTTTSTSVPSVGICGETMWCPPPPSWQISVSVDWERVDKIDFVIDVIGLGVDLLTIIPPTAELGVAGQPIAMIAEGVGWIKSGVELLQGDPSSALYQQTENTLERATVMIARGERLIPVIGAIGSLGSLYINLQPEISVEYK